MMYFASDMFFRDESIALKRHYSTQEEMTSDILSKWNRTVCQEDDVFILGGVGDMNLLKSLNGHKTLLQSRYEEDHMKEYVSSISKIRDSEIDRDMYSFYMKSEFGVTNVIYSGKSIQKTYSGRVLFLSAGLDLSQSLAVCGLSGEYHRVFKRGINANIYLNGMYPISEVDIEEMAKHTKDPW